ncbi:MAG: hypothetical protein HY332_20090 [Chloroflexi bacterium]|nr:hypothetical protein [Chloroflexota bacterium]
MTLGGVALLFLVGGGAAASAFGVAPIGQQRVVEGSFSPVRAADYGTGRPVPVAPVVPAGAGGERPTVVRAAAPETPEMVTEGRPPSP